MAIMRMHKTANYTVMSNSHFKQKDMSLKAKGLLSLMLSLPDDWDYSILGLCTLSKDGKDSVMAALKELEGFGYLVRTREVDKRGRFVGFNYDVFEEPQTALPYAENPDTEKPNTEKPYAENPDTEKPNTEKPYAENPPQLITKPIKSVNNKKTEKQKGVKGNGQVNNSRGSGTSYANLV